MVSERQVARERMGERKKDNKEVLNRSCFLKLKKKEEEEEEAILHQDDEAVLVK